jgi:hypothetical protein
VLLLLPVDRVGVYKETIALILYVQYLLDVFLVVRHIEDDRRGLRYSTLMFGINPEGESSLEGC